MNYTDCKCGECESFSGDMQQCDISGYPASESDECCLLFEPADDKGGDQSE